MQQSQVFIDAFTTEYLFRLKMGKLDLVSQSLLPEDNGSSSSLMHYPQRQRRMFNSVKMQQQGRAKLLSAEDGVHIAMFEELI